MGYGGCDMNMTSKKLKEIYEICFDRTIVRDMNPDEVFFYIYNGKL